MRVFRIWKAFGKPWHGLTPRQISVKTPWHSVKSRHDFGYNLSSLRDKIYRSREIWCVKYTKVQDSNDACLGALIFVKFNLFQSNLERENFGMHSHAPGQ